MMADDARNTPLKDPTREAAALLHELAEALTALGNYVEVSKRKIECQPALMPEGLGQAVEKSLGQYERAVVAVRRLRKILLRENRSSNCLGVGSGRPAVQKS